MTVWSSMPSCAARRYETSTLAPPTGRLATRRPMSSWPWKSLKPSSFTCRLPLVHRLPFGTWVCVQVPSALRVSVVQGLPSSHVTEVQMTATEPVAGQEGAGSPSDTDRVMVAMPGVMQVKLVEAADGLATTPELAIHWKLSADGPASLSCAVPIRATELPTNASAGLADTPSIVGQTLSVPLTVTLPVRGASWHSRWTETGTFWPATTVKLTGPPPQVVAPSVEVPESDTLKPLPAGRPPIVADSVRLLLTSMVPVFENEFGPVIR